MTYANPNRHKAYLTDRYYQQRDQRLDSYAAAQMFDPVKTPEDFLPEREEFEAVKTAMLKLPAKAERVVRARFGINVEPQSLDQVARTLGTSRTRPQQITDKSLRTLARRMRRWSPDKYARREVIDHARQHARLHAHQEQPVTPWREQWCREATPPAPRFEPPFDAKANYRRLLIQYGLGGYLPRAEQHE